MSEPGSSAGIVGSSAHMNGLFSGSSSSTALTPSVNPGSRIRAVGAGAGDRASLAAQFRPAIEPPGSAGIPAALNQPAKSRPALVRKHGHELQQILRREVAVGSRYLQLQIAGAVEARRVVVHHLGAHATAPLAAFPVLRGRDARLDGVDRCEGSFPLTAGSNLPRARMFRAAFTSRS